MASQSKGKIQKRRLYDAAARLFAEKGYHGASLADLAGELGLNKSSLYHYMESKEDLLYRLLDDYISQALDQIEQLAGRDLHPREKLKQTFLFYARFYISDPARLVLLVNEVKQLTGKRRRSMLEKERRYLAAFTGMLAQLKQTGEMKDLPETVAAFSFFGMVHYTYQWFKPRGNLDADSLAQVFWDIFSQGALPPRGPEGKP